MKEGGREVAAAVAASHSATTSAAVSVLLYVAVSQLNQCLK